MAIQNTRTALITIFSFTVASAGLSISPANAASTSEMISMCTQAAEEQNLITTGEYTARMKSVRGASVKRLSLRYVSSEKGADDVLVECKVRRDKVTEVVAK